MNNHFDHLNSSDIEEFKKVFYTQAYEIIEDLQDTLLKLEADPEDERALKSIKRYVHTLKGDANSCGLNSIGTLCHRIEDMLTSLMDGSKYVSFDEVDLLLNCVDIIHKLLLESESGENGTEIDSIMKKIDRFLLNNPAPTTAGNQNKSLQYSSTEYQKLQVQEALKKGLNLYEIEVDFDPRCGEKSVAAFMVAQRLEERGEILFTSPEIEGSEIDRAEKVIFMLSSSLPHNQFEGNISIEGITNKITISPRQESERGFEPELNESGIKGRMLRVEVSKVDRLMNLIGELIIGRSMIGQMVRDIEDGTATDNFADTLVNAHSFMERTVSELQDGVMKMRMVPINHVFRKFPKIVRNLSAEKAKKVQLEIFGRETEIDKGIVDALGEPLAHIIRNMVDHGIEEPAYRSSVGKSEEGKIRLRAYHESTQIIIEISDDGKGIDIEKLKQKAIEKGFLDEKDSERLSDDEATNLIFLPGLSTSDTISDISGRGVGMDAVKTAVEDIKGTIAVESASDSGTMFTLRLPLTLAVIKALLFEVSGKLYAIPISAIAEVTKLEVNDLVTVDGRDTLLLRDQIISIIHLDELFRINGNGNKQKFALVLSLGGKKVGLLVDRIEGQQELVIKAVDEMYSRSGLVAGASILGNGRVILILDTPAIFRKAIDDEKNKAVEA
jgi:two-component system chemotaxis sensor kinase CheA